MKSNFSYFICCILLCELLFVLGCGGNAQVENKNSTSIDSLESLTELQTVGKKELKTTRKIPIIDPRDGELYLTVKIGADVWFAENARFDSKGSMLNPENPDPSYGRIFTIEAAQSACPAGWHLPSDAEWDQLEIAHGMPASFVGQGGWRGEHADAMRSQTGWEEGENGTDSLGFNVLPAGYYFSGDLGAEQGLDGLGFSAAFWSSTVEDITFARFMFSAREFVNKWEDKSGDSGAGMSCRCVMDK